jgi:HK97 family phage prohead protease
MSLIIRSFALPPREQRKMTKDENGEFRMSFVISTTTEDSHGTIIEQDWKLDRYRVNPIVLFMHGSSGGYFGEDPPVSERVPIARSENIFCTSDKTKLEIVFPAEGRDANSDTVRRAVEDGRLNATSVGFRPGKVTEETDNDTGKTRYRLSKCELFEVSIVDIPSNPDCVAERAMLRSFLDAPITPAAAPGSAAPQPQEAATAAPNTRSAENSMSLEILLRTLGLTSKDADVNAGIDAVHALNQKVADADKRAAAAEQRATSVEQSAAPVVAFRTATLAALSLPESASQGDVTGAIVKLTGRAAKADELEPLNVKLAADAKAFADATAKREIDWIVTRGKDYDVPGGEKIRKSLEAHRQSDPTGFAETYKPALDGLRAFDNEDLFKVRSVVGQSPTQSTPAAGRSNGSDLSARAEAFVQRKAKAGVTISLPEALQAVAYGEDC